MVKALKYPSQHDAFVSFIFEQVYRVLVTFEASDVCHEVAQGTSFLLQALAKDSQKVKIKLIDNVSEDKNKNQQAAQELNTTVHELRKNITNVTVIKKSNESFAIKFTTKAGTADYTAVLDTFANAFQLYARSNEAIYFVSSATEKKFAIIPATNIAYCATNEYKYAQIKAFTTDTLTVDNYEVSFNASSKTPVFNPVSINYNLNPVPRANNVTAHDPVTQAQKPATELQADTQPTTTTNEIHKSML